MLGFLLAQQRPPEPQRVDEHVVTRLEHVYEIDPLLMSEHVAQQEMPLWDTQRIVSSRVDHIAWMHDHWADKVISPDPADYE